MTVKYAAPDDVADELTRQHAVAMDCDDCDVYDDIWCRYHQGYREGTRGALRARDGFG